MDTFFRSSVSNDEKIFGQILTGKKVGTALCAIHDPELNGTTISEKLANKPGCRG